MTIVIAFRSYLLCGFNFRVKGRKPFQTCQEYFSAPISTSSQIRTDSSVPFA
jgi:hypothetical protein